MTLFVGTCTSGLATHGEHGLQLGGGESTVVTYFDRLGRVIAETNQDYHLSDPRIYCVMASCVFCGTPLVISNLGWPSGVRYHQAGTDNPWREAPGGKPLVDEYIILEQERALCL